MPIEQVKLNTKALKCPVPATLKISRGKIGLYRGEHARVEIWTSKPKPLCLCRKIGDETKRKFFGLDEITLANDTARHYELQARANGLNFGTISDDEKRALMIWRDFVFRETKAGNPPRRLSEIVAELVEREQHADETPLFRDVAFQFLEYKERARAGKLDYRERLGKTVKRLAAAFPRAQIGEITETRFLAALAKICKARDGKSPAAPKTLNHWKDTAKEIFCWFYSRENKRRIREGFPALDNPLELLTKEKIRKTSEPQTISPAAAREILCDLLRHAPAAVPVVAVQMFAGVRNAEALRLRWRDIRANEIFLSLAITKTAETRTAPVAENLREWINAAIAAGAPASPETLIFARSDTPAAALAEMDADARERVELENFKTRKAALTKILARTAKRLGFRKPANAFRHTAVSALCKIHGFEKASDYCGHDIRTQGKYYRAAMSASEAADYFGIVPPAGDGKAIAFSREGAKDRATAARDGQRDAAQGETATPDAAASA